MTNETAYAQLRNVVVFVFPTPQDAEIFIQQLETKNLMNKLSLPRLSFRKGFNVRPRT